MSAKFLFAALAPGLLLAGCGSSDAPQDPNDVKIEKKLALTKEQKVANTYLSEMDSLANALSDVTDQESAEKAAAEIRKISETMNAMSQEYGEELGEKKMVAIMMSRSQEFMAVQQRVAGQMARIGMTDPSLMQLIGDEMKNLPGK